MTAILHVRISSRLDADELERRMRERLPAFNNVPGLIQKIFARDPDSNAICGIYFFEDRAALDAYRDSELAKSIPAAYAATQVRREIYDLVAPLFPQRGPAADLS